MPSVPWNEEIGNYEVIVRMLTAPKSKYQTMIASTIAGDLKLSIVMLPVEACPVLVMLMFLAKYHVDLVDCGSFRPRGSGTSSIWLNAAMQKYHFTSRFMI